MTKRCYLFPGQGSQYVGMGRDLFEQSPGIFERANAALGFDLTKIMFEGPDEELRKTEYAQPAILTHSVAASLVLPTADYYVGHSLGEYSALVAVGVLQFEDAVKAVHLRGRFMQEAVPLGTGAMAAVLYDDADLIKHTCDSIENYVAVANYNGPGQTVISGTVAGVQEAIARLKELGVRRILMLPVSAPFHCQLMRPAQEKLASHLQSINFSATEKNVISGVTATVERNPNRIRELLVEQVVSSIQFTRMIELLKNQNVREFVEVGPGKTLVGIVKRVIQDATCC